jgi:hypothetical protein
LPSPAASTPLDRIFLPFAANGELNANGEYPPSRIEAVNTAAHAGNSPGRRPWRRRRGRRSIFRLSPGRNAIAQAAVATFPRRGRQQLALAFLLPIWKLHSLLTGGIHQKSIWLGAKIMA